MSELEENLELEENDEGIISGISYFSCPTSSMSTSHLVVLVGNSKLSR